MLQIQNGPFECRLYEVCALKERRIIEIMLVQRFAFDVELLAIATKLDLKVKELSIRITLDNSFDIREVAKMFIDILGISYRLRITRYYQRSVAQNLKLSNMNE